LINESPTGAAVMQDLFASRFDPAKGQESSANYCFNARDRAAFLHS